MSVNLMNFFFIKKNHLYIQSYLNTYTIKRYYLYPQIHRNYYTNFHKLCSDTTLPALSFQLRAIITVHR